MHAADVTRRLTSMASRHAARASARPSTRRLLRGPGRVIHAEDRSSLSGCRAPGSTLIEQILASHSQVEGTMELQNVPAIVRDLGLRGRHGDGYPEIVATLDPEALAAGGQRYLAETAALHPTRPLFTDKLPNNFLHVGLIAAMLPNAILDRCAPASDGRLFFGLQAAFRRGPDLYLRP
jgi:hypothetical protein